MVTWWLYDGYIMVIWWVYDGIIWWVYDGIITYYVYIYIYMVGGAITILKNDGVRQWEGWHPIYEMENKI